MPPKTRPKKRASGLKPYRQKRNFANTPEPGASKRSASKRAKKSARSFVVQEHHARNLHYDFRLEIDGLLVSWAVPKGPPEDPAAKRLAVHVEDHPLEYGSFSGIIPKGNYGAGKVEIWDKGEWEPTQRNWRQEFEKGHFKFVLRGDRLKGTYLLARMKEEPNWLWRKIDENTSADGKGEITKEKAAFVKPQLARVVPSVPTGKEWIHEIKLDGYRLIAVKRAGKVQLFTRSSLDWTDKFANLADELAKVSKKDFILDGEAVVFDEKGRSSFGDLQGALKGKGRNIDFVVFDLLHFDGENLRGLPLTERQKRLEKLVPQETGRVRRSKVWSADQGKDLFTQACKAGLEGIISKRGSTIYLEDSRNDWVKSKCRARQEFVICGYTPPRNSCPAFGALVLGSLENGKLVPRGKVGTGFNEAKRRELLKTFQKLGTDQPAFGDAEKGIHWIKPKLVAEIEFAEITKDGSIRQGSFVGLREDKQAKDVHLDSIQVAKKEASDLTISGITISHPDRLVFPKDQVTKFEVASFFEKVGDWMMPFVENRPLAIIRAPSGITGEQFFQKSFPNHVPEHVKTTTLDDGTQVMFIKKVEALVSLAQFGMIEVHPWGAPMPTGEKPDVLIWDLDPDPSVPWKEVQGAAHLLRDFLLNLGLETQLKTSGGKGLHLMLYLKRSHGWETLRTFSKAVASAVAAMNPKKFTVTASKAKRSGKIYIDWMRNGRGATCIAPWCVRARPGAPISRPINWDELLNTTADGFTIREPLVMPSEWKKIRPQSITKAILKELGVA
jgi:bifunctional non-homologous end joining protein LigD